MSDELTRLRIENRELREELDEWRRRANDAAAPSSVHSDIARWLGTNAAARVLQALLEANGRPVSRERLGSICSQRPDEVDAILLAKVQVYNLRKALRRRGMTDVIRTVWGVGYELTPHGVERLRQALA